MSELGRRELKTRQKNWPRRIAAWLSARGVSANTVSVLSMVCAIGTVACWWPYHGLSPVAKSVLLVAGVAFIQLRLLCNLLDGLIAVEGGKRSATGDLYNDAPDRFSDALVLVAAGYLTYEPALGWLAALLAVTTAYVRTLATAVAGTHDYGGPMAKQHRMFLLSVAGIGGAIESFNNTSWVMTVALVVIAAGSLATVIRRLMHAARVLRERG